VSSLIEWFELIYNRSVDAHLEHSCKELFMNEKVRFNESCRRLYAHQEQHKEDNFDVAVFLMQSVLKTLDDESIKKISDDIDRWLKKYSK